MPKPSKGQIQAAGKLRRKAGTRCSKQPDKTVERVGFTLAPGNELHIDFGLVHGKVVISYPAGQNPVVKVYNTDDGEPKVFELQRARILAALERLTQ